MTLIPGYLSVFLAGILGLLSHSWLNRGVRHQVEGWFHLATIVNIFKSGCQSSSELSREKSVIFGQH